MGPGSTVLGKRCGVKFRRGNPWQGNGFETGANLYRGGYLTYPSSRTFSSMVGC
jgi:hypothetical protein